jgi:hypothetical protein
MIAANDLLCSHISETVAAISAEALASQLEAEVLLLQHAYRGWVAHHGRSTVGLSGLSMTECARYVAA